jgi:hypothetical protein
MGKALCVCVLAAAGLPALIFFIRVAHVHARYSGGNDQRGD